MTFDELFKRISAILPDCQFAKDDDGQLIIYTGLSVNEELVLEEFDS